MTCGSSRQVVPLLRRITVTIATLLHVVGVRAVLTTAMLSIVGLLAVTTAVPGHAAEPIMNKPAAPQFAKAMPLEGVEDQITFLYYEDLAAPRKFYGKVLGLESYYEQEWVSLYRVAPGASIGIVKSADQKIDADAKANAAMVSIVTEDVDSWFERLKSREGVIVLKAIYDHPAVPIRAFLLQDPGGYSVEFLQWRR